VSRLIEAIDRTAPRTKQEMATELGLSEDYLSELLQELKRDGLVRKAYVVDDEAVYDRAGEVSPLTGGTGDDAGRGPTVLEQLERLAAVTTDQYAAARAAFEGDSPEQPADALEPVSNERYYAVVEELKSYTLTTNWPGNRVAADLVTVATDLELVGDRACFVANTVADRETGGHGTVEERVLDVFDAGLRIEQLFRAVLFDASPAAFDRLRAEEEAVHTELNELFELVTAYSPELYGALVAVTRALERAIYYWVDAAEIAVRLHTGLEASHAES